MGALNLTGGLIPILSGLAGTVRAAEQTLASFDTRRDDNLALEQLQARQRLAEQQASANAAADQALRDTQSAQDEERRRAALRRAVARQRASFGAAGLTAGSGSSEAVLLGLTEETEDELKRRTQLDTLRNTAQDLGLSQQRSVNVLQATQLAERQNIGRLFNFPISS